MKKKEIITVILTAVLLAALIAGCVYLATSHRREARKPKTFGIVNSMYEISDQYIYFNYNTKLMRFDTSTDTLEKLCADAECDGGCILENAGYTSRIYRNRFYFNFYGDTSGFAYYDIKTGATTIIKQYDELVLINFFLYNGNIYHMKHTMGTNSPAVYRVSVDSGKEKAILDLETGERLLMVADGLIFTAHTVTEGNGEDSIRYSTVYAYDTVTLKRREIWHTDKSKYNGISSRAHFYDGKLYFHINTYQYDELGSMIGYLCKLDTVSGEASYFSEGPSGRFYLTYEGIYIETNKVISTPIDKFGDIKVRLDREKDVLLFDYGENSLQMTYQNSNITSYLGFIANRKYIGDIKYSDLEGKRSRFVVINLETGEIKDIPEP